MKKIFENTLLLVIALFLISIIVYIFTANQTVTYTDNGELAAACIALGISHPTGYPLFTIIGHLWSYLDLPFSQIASMNLLASVFTALSSIFLFLIIKLVLQNFSIRNKNITKSKKKTEITYTSVKLKLEDSSINLISFITSLSFSFALTVWAQANSLEVYSLEILLMNIVIFSSLKAYFQPENRKLFFITAFLFGLAMTNHMTSVLMFPSILWIYFLNENNKLNFNKKKVIGLLWLIIPFVAALTLYLYLPIRSSMEPLINWGWVHRDLEKFLYHFQGKQYQIWMFSGSETIIKNLGTYFSILPFQFGFIGLLFSLYGIIKSSKNKPIFWFLLLLIFFNIAYSVNYSIFDIDSYFLLSIIALFIFMAIGIAFLSTYSGKYLYSGIIVILLNLYINYRENDHSEDFMVHEYTKNMVNAMEKNAIVFSAQWDYFVAPFMYLQLIEGLRHDIVIVEKELLRRTWYPLQFKKWHPEIYSKSEREFKEFEKILESFESDLPYSPEEIQMKFENVFESIIRHNINNRPIYLTMDVLQSESKFFDRYIVKPQGFALRVQLKDSVISTHFDKLNLRYFENAKGQFKGILPENLEMLIGDNLFNLALYSYQINQYKESQKILDKALILNPNHQMGQRLRHTLNN